MSTPADESGEDKATVASSAPAEIPQDSKEMPPNNEDSGEGSAAVSIAADTTAQPDGHVVEANSGNANGTNAESTNLDAQQPEPKPTLQPAPELEPEIPILSNTGRPSRRAARVAVATIHKTVAIASVGPKGPLSEKELEKRQKLKSKKAELTEKYDNLLAMNPKKKKKAKGRTKPTRQFVEPLHADLAAIRGCQEFVAVAQFMYLLGNSLGIQLSSLEELECEYQDPESIVVGDMNAKLIRKLLNREDVISSNWVSFFPDVVANEDPNLDISPYAIEYKNLDVVRRVEITHMLQCWLCAKPELREVMNQYSPDAFRQQPIGRDSRNNLYWDFGDLRLYRESAQLRTASYKGKKPADDGWGTACLTAEEWAQVTRQFSNTSSRVEKDLFQVLHGALPHILQQMQKKEMDAYRREISGDDVEEQAKAEQAFRAEQEKKRAFREKEEKRLEELASRQAQISEKKLARKAEKAATANFPNLAEAEKRAKRDFSRARDKALREVRAREREERIIRQQAIDEAKRQYTEKIRQFRYEQRFARANGLPVPELPEELREPPQLSITESSSGTVGQVSLDFDGLLGLYPRKRLKHSSGKCIFTTKLAEAATQALLTAKVASMREWHDRYEEARKAESKRRSQALAQAKQQEKARQRRLEKEEAKRVALCSNTKVFGVDSGISRSPNGVLLPGHEQNLGGKSSPEVSALHLLATAARQPLADDKKDVDPIGKEANPSKLNMVDHNFSSEEKKEMSTKSKEVDTKKRKPEILRVDIEYETPSKQPKQEENGVHELTPAPWIDTTNKQTTSFEFPGNGGLASIADEEE